MASTHATDTPECVARPGPRRPQVVSLHDPRAGDASLVGAKAANLAGCVDAGLPVLPGLVVTTEATAGWPIGDAVPGDVLDALRACLDAEPATWSGPLVVRSSSTVEDAERSSMAGRFRSELGVVGWEAIARALRAVRDSAARVVGPDGTVGPIAILLQPQVAADRGGVLFGVDPVQGDRRHLVVEVTPGDPSELVSGRAAAVHVVLSRRGRRIGSTGEGVSLGRRDRRALARLATGVERILGMPQDVEWAIDGDGKLWLLQSRPVTAVAEHEAGPLLGPGPVAETFPEPLRRLELDLWLDPLRRGIVRALRVTGASSARQVARSPVALAVNGWAAVDLELLGLHRRRSRLGPLTGARRLVAAWRVGRLRASLPALAADVLAEVDEHLADVPPLASLGDAELVALLANSADELVAVHGYEVMAGMLLRPEPSCTPAPALALATLAQARERGQSDAEVIATEPVVLCLTAPRVGGTTALPPTPDSAPAGAIEGRLGVRDDLRLRTRWLQELSGRAIAVLGDRLVATGRLPRAELVRDLAFGELQRVVGGGSLPADLDGRAARAAGAPLPAEFRLTPAGEVVAARLAAGRTAGLGAGGGRAVGRVCHRWSASHPVSEAVLVVPTLDPGLATVLPALNGLVSETGSALSHLAILAREYGIPTVVGVAEARRRFPVGSRILVDGHSGEVRRLVDAEAASASEDAASQEAEP